MEYFLRDRFSHGAKIRNIGDGSWSAFVQFRGIIQRLVQLFQAWGVKPGDFRNLRKGHSGGFQFPRHGQGRFLQSFLVAFFKPFFMAFL